ncbi:hypothetical protein J3L11_18905 [Shewanella sp. 4t3-1-2LB]|uniref:hypothetical protein n=1 Tax=Shewanella sp. 4t3-1-2LB TaxID=2817682 RepID=UPI001A9991D3|nr:hypothetical protein [Shewanella sp. 4t3-1-2LB]MBO1273696.1 hypothetical protein [Shewanella sp. 4t3-1-2LB]
MAIQFYSNDPVDVLGHLSRGNSPSNGFNRYAYANNNPYKYVDPDGEFAFFIPLIGAAIGGYQAFKMASDMGASNSEAFIAGAVGALVGGLSGGIVGTTAGFGVKVAAQQALTQGAAKTAAQTAGAMASGFASGAATQMAGDAIGDISRGEVPK